MLGWLRGLRERDDPHLVKGAALAPPEVDPIEELARLLSDRPSAPLRATYAPAASARGRPTPRGSARA